MAGENENWEAYVRQLYQTNWMGVVVACLSPLNLENVEQGLQLIRIVPWAERTTFQQRLRTAVNKKFQEHATGKEWIVNITGGRVSLQLTYDDDLNTIINASSRSKVRELFVWYLNRASLIYRDRGDTEKRTEAENLVVAILNL
jgi:hypothetical protein